MTLSEDLKLEPSKRLKSEALAAPNSVGLSGSVNKSTRQRRKLLIVVMRVLVVVVVLGGWEFLVRIKVIDSFFWGQPTGIVAQLWTWITEGTAQGPLWQQIAVTMEETLLGFFFGAAFGIVIGIALARIHLLADIFGPFINIGNSIPRVVLGPLFIVAMGLGIESKIMLSVVMVFFAVFYNVFQGVREVDRNLLANARILGATPWQISLHVVLPSALTWIIASLHISFGLALVGAVVSEFLGALKGLGLLIATAQGTFNPNGLFAAILILAVVTLIVEWLVTRLEGVLLKWRPTPISDIGF
jgi:NitT/TauT family transport system permease protein